MKITVYKSENRGRGDYGWLKTRYSFSFANFYNPALIRFGTLRVLNDDEVAPGAGFGTHPHDNMEIVTIPLEGSLEHKDSMGNGSVITAGEVQVMSAGTGVEHSEFNPSKTESVKLLQIWIFPKERDIQPRYDQMKFDFETLKNEFLTLVSPQTNEKSLSIHQDAYFKIGKFDKGYKLNLETEIQGNGIYAFLLNGKVVIDGNELSNRDAVGISETNSVSVEFTEDSKILTIEVPMIN
jgi:quercetin 2,3-dioxygenase